jgi:hypothetical protein
MQQSKRLVLQKSTSSQGMASLREFFSVPSAPSRPLWLIFPTKIPLLFFFTNLKQITSLHLSKKTLGLLRD